MTPEEAKHHLEEIQKEVKLKRITKPVTVKTKQECPTCGTKNKAGAKFCRECGTSLSVTA